MIEINDLSVDYRDNGRREAVISNLDLSVEDGDSLCIIGPNGCGKTTLLHVIAGLQEDYSGNLRIDTSPEKISLILQNIGLLPWKTVWKNATLGLDLGREGDYSKVNDILKDLDLYSHKDNYPSQLSGGQKRKLGIARALAVDPEILLMDEPLVSLDEFTSERLQDQVLQIWAQRNLTLITVTHDMEEATFLGQNIVVLTHRPAQVKTHIPNEHPSDPEFRRSKQFYETVKKTREELP